MDTPTTRRRRRPEDEQFDSMIADLAGPSPFSSEPEAPEEDYDSMMADLAGPSPFDEGDVESDAASIADDYLSGTDLSPLETGTPPGEDMPFMMISTAEAQEDADANPGVAAASEEMDPSALASLDPTEDSEEFDMVITPEQAEEDEYLYGTELPGAPETDLNPVFIDMDWAEETDAQPWYVSGDEPPDVFGPYRRLDTPSLGEDVEESPEETPEAFAAGDVAPEGAEALGDPAAEQDDGIAEAPAGPAEPASALGDPTDAPEGAEDKELARYFQQVDSRIARLEQLRRSTGNVRLAGLIGQLIQTTIASASRALGSYASGRYDDRTRPYEDMGPATQAGMQRLDRTIAEQGSEWAEQDQLRDRTAIEAERLRQQGDEQATLASYRQGQLAARGRQLDEAERMGTARREELGTRAARTDATRQREVDEGLPESDRSGRSREAFRMSVETLPPDVRDAFADRIANLDTLSAREIRELSDDIHHFAQGRLARRDGQTRRGSGTGGGPASEATLAAVRARVNELRQHNIVDEATGEAIVAGFSDRNPRRRQEVAAQLDDLASRLPGRPRAPQPGAPAGDPSAREVLPGVFSHLSGLEDREVVAVRQDFRAYRASLQHLRFIRDTVRQHGLRAFVDPQIRASIQRRMPALRQMITQIQGTGIIQIGERELIDAELPDPTSVTQQTLQLYGPNLDSWIAQNNEMAIGALEDYGVDREGLARARQILNSDAGSAPVAPRRGRPAAAPQAPAEGGSGEGPDLSRARRTRTGNIVMRGPNGLAQTAPERVQQRLDEGWIIIEE